MKITAFAPHLAGRMLPGLFSCDLKIGQRERFPGDPWPYFAPSPQWHWMHTTECGSPNHIGSYRSRPIHCSRREPFSDEFVVYVTPRPREGAIDRPSVGSMGTGQPADAGPQGELFAEAAA